MVYFLFLFLLNLLGMYQCDEDGIFTSTVDLQHLVQTQNEVIRVLNDFLEAEDRKMESLKKAIFLFKVSASGSDLMDTEEYVSNPLNSYLLIKKLASDFKNIFDIISENENGKILSDNITSGRSWLMWPSEEDLRGAAVGLNRLQDIYNIRTDDLSVGTLNGVSYGPKLSAHDCFELGRQSYIDEDHYHTEVWMTQALIHYEEEDIKTVNRADIYDYLSYSAYMQENLKKALKYVNLLLLDNPTHTRSIDNKKFFEKKILEVGGVLDTKQIGDDGLPDTHEKAVRRRNTNEYNDNYDKLCRGEGYIDPEITKNLKCYYSTGAEAFLNIGPVKMEELYSSPYIVMYHDVITDKEISIIKNLATPKFARATVQNSVTGDLETATYRISKTAWLTENDNDVINNIYQRVHDITGLNMETSEQLQVSNYGIGGHYAPHFDFARREETDAFSSLNTGNRIATWLFYESDVEQGGATVFTSLGLTLYPKKGSAVFWYNLYKNGEGNDYTRHAACPVLKGTKWVSNFWIHERGQEFTYPCSLSPYE